MTAHAPEPTVYWVVKGAPSPECLASHGGKIPVATPNVDPADGLYTHSTPGGSEAWCFAEAARIKANGLWRRVAVAEGRWGYISGGQVRALIRERVTEVEEPTVSGAALRELRVTAGLTLNQLAERIGRDIRTVQRWEAGDSPISRAVLPVILEAFADPALPSSPTRQQVRALICTTEEAAALLGVNHGSVNDIMVRAAIEPLIRGNRGRSSIWLASEVAAVAARPRHPGRKRPTRHDDAG